MITLLACVLQFIKELSYLCYCFRHLEGKKITTTPFLPKKFGGQKETSGAYLFILLIQTETLRREENASMAY